MILVLHPKYKLKYFEKLGWDDAWIKMAEGIIKDKYFEKLGWDDAWIKTAEGIIKDKFKRSYMDYVLTKPPTDAAKVHVPHFLAQAVLLTYVHHLS